MIGDVNLFLKGSPDDPEGEFEVEVEIMIAGGSHFPFLQTNIRPLLISPVSRRQNLHIADAALRRWRCI